MSEIEKYTRILETLSVEEEPRLVLVRRAFKSLPQRIAVLDSSFNPPTRAHVRLLELATERFNLDHRLLLLAKTNVDKTIFGAPLPYRVEMMDRLAVHLGNTSLGLTAHALFANKAKAVKRGLGTATEIFFILGMDTALRLFDPKYYEDIGTALHELFQLARVICANRAGYDREELERVTSLPDFQPFRSRISFLDLEEDFAAISSTDARRMLATRKAQVRDLVPECLLRYLEQHRFYRD